MWDIRLAGRLLSPVYSTSFASIRSVASHQPVLPQPDFIPLLYNAALLLVLVMVYDFATIHQVTIGRPARQIMNGVAIGIIGIGIMMAPMHLEEGIIFDTRSVLLCITGLFLGPITTIIAMVMTIILRILQGGTATLTGCCVILTAGGIGIAWRYYRRGNLHDMRVREFVLLGMAVHVVMLLLMLLMPLPTALRVLSHITPPVMTLYPLATVVLGLLLRNRIRRERVSQDLAESEDRYRSLFENNHAIMLIVDPEHSLVVDVNPAATSFYGWSREEMRGMPLSQVNSLEPTELVRQMERAIAFEANTFEFRHIKADGSLCEVEVFSGPITIGGRRLLYSIVQDISARKRAQEALRQSEERYRLLVKLAPIGIAVHRHGCLVFANEAGAAIMGAASPDDLIGTPINSIIHPDILPQTLERMQAMLRGVPNLYPNEEQFVRLDGTVIDVEVTAAPITYETQPAVLVIVTDITARKRMAEEEHRMYAELEESRKRLVDALAERTRAEEQVRQLNADLEKRVQVRTAELETAIRELEAFSYSVSHDLRAPLRALNGFTRILADGHGHLLNAEGRYALGVIESEAHRLGQLIDDLLEFSRLGRKALSCSFVDQTTIVRSVFDELRIEHPTPGLDLRIHPLPVVSCDPRLMRQVWVNLVDNALKFSRNREAPIIEVEGELGGHEAVFHIRDNGAGFDMAYSDKLFGVFQRLHSKEEFEGTGVGLALVQRIVHRHGGRIWAEGEVGRGAAFHFALPLHTA